MMNDGYCEINLNIKPSQQFSTKEYPKDRIRIYKSKNKVKMTYGIKELSEGGSMCGSTSVLCTLHPEKKYFFKYNSPNLYLINNKRLYYIEIHKYLQKQSEKELDKSMINEDTIDDFFVQQSFYPRLITNYMIVKPELNWLNKQKKEKYDIFTLSKYEIQNLFIRSIESSPIPLSETVSDSTPEPPERLTADSVKFDPNYKPETNRRERATTTSIVEDGIYFTLPGRADKTVDIPVPSNTVVKWDIDISISDLSYTAIYIEMNEKYKKEPKCIFF